MHGTEDDAVARDVFPHPCPLSVIGSSRASCLLFTIDVNTNRNACIKSECNCSLRRCYMCLEDGKGRSSGLVADPRRGLCTHHVDLIERGERMLKVPLDKPRLSLPNVTPALVRAPVQMPVRPVVAASDPAPIARAPETVVTPVRESATHMGSKAVRGTGLHLMGTANPRTDKQIATDEKLGPLLGKKQS
jgi:hypothetical protein